MERMQHFDSISHTAHSITLTTGLLLCASALDLRLYEFTLTTHIDTAPFLHASEAGGVTCMCV